MMFVGLICIVFMVAGLVFAILGSPAVAVPLFYIGLVSWGWTAVISIWWCK